MDRQLRSTVAAAGLLTLSVSSFGGSAFAQTKGASDPVAALMKRVEQRYAHLKSWTATYSATRTESSAQRVTRVTNPSGSIVFTAPDSIVVTPSGKGPIFGSCAEPGALMFLCNFSGAATFHLGEDSSALVLAGETMKRSAQSEIIVFYIDRTTYEVLRVSTFDNNGSRNQITFNSAAAQR